MIYYNIRVVEAKDLFDATEKVENGRFNTNHSLSDIVVSEKDIVIEISDPLKDIYESAPGYIMAGNKMLLPNATRMEVKDIEAMCERHNLTYRKIKVKNHEKCKAKWSYRIYY